MLQGIGLQLSDAILRCWLSVSSSRLGTSVHLYLASHCCLLALPALGECVGPCMLVLAFLGDGKSMTKAMDHNAVGEVSVFRVHGMENRADLVCTSQLMPPYS